MPNSAFRSVRDTDQGYGIVSRALHWGMAFLFSWQFTSAVLHAVNRDWAISGFFWGTHREIGFLLFLLVLARGVWGFLNLKRRPPHVGLVGHLAALGHLALYGLMVLVPGVALVRQFGSGRPFSFFGLPIMAGGGARIDWMVALGNAVHGLAGWILLALIAGHVAMVVVHERLWKDGTLRLMLPGLAPAAGR
ncbi:cytochrome b [Segnochrobactraceae bacterium EtOH-i3]